VIGAHGASAMGGGAVAGTAEDMRKQRFHKLMQQLRRESPKIQLNDKSKICCLKHSATFLGNC
jgi:hypothetical protein